MSDATTRIARLRAVVDHAEKHGLGEHLADVSVYNSAKVQIFERVGKSAIAVLLPWARSIGAVTASVIKSQSDYHLTVSGHIDPNVPLSVVIITRDDETAALDDAGFDNTNLNGWVPLDVLAKSERPLAVAIAGGAR